MFAKARALLTGLGLGAGWMYLFDPQVGKRRRSLLRDQCVSSINHTTCWFDKALRDAGHRLEGILAEAQCMFDSSTPSDETLVERVRATLGHVASHPRLIDVHVAQGRVTLTGHAPADETPGIVSCVSSVRGVRSFDNQLDSHLGRDVTNDGQHRRRVQPPIDVMRENWAPSTRLVLGTLASALMFNCMLRRTPGAIVMGTLGFGLFIRAVSNRDVIEEGREIARPITQKMQARGDINPTTAPVMTTS